MYPTSSQSACDTVVCLLSTFVWTWKPLVQWMTAASATIIVVGIVVAMIALWMARRQVRDAQHARTRRVVDAWMDAVSEAQLVVSAVDPTDATARASAQREVARRIAVAEGVSALDEQGPGLGAGEAIRQRVLQAIHADDPSKAESSLRTARLMLRAWIDGDHGERMRYATGPR